ncbi:MAG: hypothetical protein A2035_03140 [Nitrospirae bacterium GWA2_42_11]|nr:MAG: hypothetical protein A2035_03140 [Nitrospirae bacterium GWA2_42_11]
MNRDWETVFRNWAKPSSDTEQQKCGNAVKMVCDAISGDSALSQKNIEVFPQGSYRNNTNVRQDSDVDICVCLLDVCLVDFSMSGALTDQIVGLNSSDYTYGEFKNSVEKALVAKFGRANVRRCNKAFDIHANTYRVDADVVPCFEHRRYTGERHYDSSYYYLSGTEFCPDNGGRIINWPQQHYENGVAKNDATGNRFKYITRVLKRLRNEMADKGIAAAKPIPSYLIECLVWNVPNEGFGHDIYTDDVRYVLAHTFNETINDEKCSEWREVNELKYLFRIRQPWTRQQAHEFLSAAWNYIGFE